MKLLVEGSGVRFESGWWMILCMVVGGYNGACEDGFDGMPLGRRSGQGCVVVMVVR